MQINTYNALPLPDYTSDFVYFYQMNNWLRPGDAYMLVIMVSRNALSPVQRQTITWTVIHNILLTGPSATNLIDISIKRRKFQPGKCI